ncbi:MAG: Cytochrome c, class [Proteobacteria bacterium]|nr:Cytochrome c, class [Pseudomonadota bacterium]
MRALILAAGLLLAGSGALAQPAVQEKLKAIQADAPALRAAVDAGKKVTFFCANCHGEDGISKTPEVPNLAGQNPAYLLEQIRKFGAGERKDPFMQGLIKVLKDDERLQAASYYSSMPVPPTKADAAQVRHGKELFGKLCVRCHGEQARGNEVIPRLAGQKLPYLKLTISRYRDKTGIRNSQLMAIATSNLKDEEIVALANYLTQLP